MTTKIEWTDETWNPITGCTKISEGCRNCYAEKMAKRLAGRVGYPAKNPFAPGTEHKNAWEKPFGWFKSKSIFTCSMGDLFHDDVPFRLVDKVLAVAALTPRHTYRILTKRPERMLEYFSDDCDWPDHLGHVAFRDLHFSEEADCQVGNAINGVLDEAYNVGWPMRNLQLGVTAENQEQADKRIPVLLQIPAAVRFVSVEPMLGPVDLTAHHWGGAMLAWLNWVICGGESGPGARPMHPDWARSLRDQCVSAGVPFFFKQWGEWGYQAGGQGWEKLVRVGKKAAGRLLDGRTWNQYPEV